MRHYWGPCYVAHNTGVLIFYTGVLNAQRRLRFFLAAAGAGAGSSCWSK